MRRTRPRRLADRFLLTRHPPINQLHVARTKPHVRCKAFPTGRKSRCKTFDVGRASDKSFNMRAGSLNSSRDTNFREVQPFHPGLACHGTVAWSCRPRGRDLEATSTLTQGAGTKRYPARRTDEPTHAIRDKPPCRQPLEA